MKRVYSLLIILFISYYLKAQIIFSAPNDPQNEYMELYKEVELNKIFKDSKTFPDAIPKSSPSDILAEYRIQKLKPGFSLQDFVESHFIVPESFKSKYVSEPESSTSAHITSLWSILTRSSNQGAETSKYWGTLISLPFPYIVPGGRFREIYYWDSYFTCLGLMEDQKVDMVENMVKNFSFLLDKVGHIPNGNRTYYLGRSQPPFFAMMVSLLAEAKGRETYVKYLPEMEKEYNYWMEGKASLQKKTKSFKNKRGILTALKVVSLGNGSYLNRYWDELNTPRSESYREDYMAVNTAFPDEESKRKAYRNIRSAAESGWDFSSRWFNGQSQIAFLNTTDILPIDLNSLLFNLEQTISIAYHIKGDELSSEKFLAFAADRRKSILKYFWNEEQGFFLDYNFITGKQSPVKSLASMFPLFFNIASPQMGDKVTDELEHSFVKPGGLVTTLNNTGQQWDSPNGWAPLQWISIEGLRNYKKFELAERIARNWIGLNDKVFKATGKMQEKYNVVDITLIGGGGEYPNQDGFGWTNGVYQKLNKIYNSH